MPSTPVPSSTPSNAVLQSTFYKQIQRDDQRLEVLEKAGLLPTSDILVQSVINGDTDHAPSGDAVFDFVGSQLGGLIVQTVTNGDTTHAPSGDAVFDALVALIVQTVTNGDTTHAPSGDAVFDHVAAAVAALLTATITNGDTTHAPNGDAVFDALALKAALASPTFTGTPAGPTAAPGTNTTQLATTAFVQAAGITTPTAWTAVTFTNSWVNFGGSYQTAQYRKNGDVVELRGLIKNGTLGSSAFTLPVGFRPPAIVEDTGQLGVQFIDINTNGTVVPGGGSNVQANLDGIAFSITT